MVRARIGHRLPGGFYISVPISTGTRRPGPPIGSYPLSAMIFVTVILTASAVLFLLTGAWLVTVFLTAVITGGWVSWVANPRLRNH